MEISASYRFDAPPARVWESLMNPETLAACIPGCESLTADGPDQYQAIINVGVGPVRGRYTAKIAITEAFPVQSYRLSINGSGSIGFASGESLVALAEADGQTMVTVTSQAQAGGTVARVGQRMLESVARGLLDRFFSCLQESVKP